MNIRQLHVGGLDRNFTYLLCDEESGDAVLIDPCGAVEIIRGAVRDFPHVRPRYILLTHGHHDHCSGVSPAREFFGAPVAAHPECSFRHDIDLEDGQRLPFGKIFIQCMYTPGHSRDSVVYHLSDETALFTGDTLFVDWCGYCEPTTMFHTMREILFPLADSNEVYPGHDYGRLPHAPLGREKRENPYLRIADYGQFCEELKNL